MADSTPDVHLDRMTDLAFAAISLSGGLLLLIGNVETRGAAWIPVPGAVAFGVDAGIGVLASAGFLFRRRWPVGLALAMLAPMVISRSAQVATVLSVFNVALRRRPLVAVAVAAAHQAVFIGFSLLWVIYPWWAAFAWVLTYHVALVALGLYFRARRGLIVSLREQVRQAQETQDLLASGARREERARIAVEMHDVLAHRVSLMALHAGGLEVRPDLPPEKVRETAGLIRSTARQALTELRDIIGVLRDAGPAEAPRAPQPRLVDIERLISEYQQAGLDVSLDPRLAGPESAPSPLGRDAYRIVREALANATKHAGGAPVAVSLRGGPGQGLRVTVRNRLPVPPVAAHPVPGRPRLAEPVLELPGAGLGLVSLAERVAVAGGTLTHGPDGNGDFVLTATLLWEA